MKLLIFRGALKLKKRLSYDSLNNLLRGIDHRFKIAYCMLNKPGTTGISARIKFLHSVIE
mgnify:FL=1